MIPVLRHQIYCYNIEDLSWPLEPMMISLNMLTTSHCNHQSIVWTQERRIYSLIFSSSTASSNLSGLLASDVAKGNVRDHEGGSGSLSPPRSASPTLDYQDNEVFSNKTNFIQEEPVRHTSTNQVSSKPSLPWSSSDRKPSRPSAGHVPAWYKDMQKGVEVPVQTIEEPESYTVKRSRPSGEYNIVIETGIKNY